MNAQNLKMKMWTFRIPETLLDRLRIAAAQRTITSGKNVSLNSVAVELLSKTVPVAKEDGTN